jgi:uncharacterized protein (DUF362 family)
MTILRHKFGPTTLAKLSDPKELKQILVDPWLKSETIILKPNLVASAPGIATDPEALRALLEALDSRIIVAEGHCLPRSMKLTRVEDWGSAPPEDGMGIRVEGKKVNWIWLMSDEGWRWQIRHPDWGWFREGGHWGQIRKEEKTFLDSRGYTDLFREFGVEFINVTDEVWSGRVADPAEVKRAVESRFKPAFIDKLYGMVPKRLHDLRGSTFISFSKMQTYNSFTMKNLFGLIIDPLRPWWHGPKDSRLADSILGINKVYRSLFNVYGICETLHTNPVIHPEGKFIDPLGTRYNIGEKLGVVACGRDPVSLDAIFCNLAGFDINQYGGYIDKAEEFGAYDKLMLRESKAKAGSWILRSHD